MAKTKILIVEDEILIARELEARLSGLGYTVVSIALSGEEAIRSAVELRPDLVLMDIVLQGTMDGIAAANEIRTRLDIPIVYVTAYADESTLQRAKVTEPYGYILKPFSESEVHAAVEMAVYKHQMERKLREAQEAGLLLAAIVESSHDAIVGWTLGGTIFSWNPGAERLYGYSATAALGQCIATFLVPPERQTEIPQILERIERGKRIDDYETVRVRKDGTRIEVLLTVSPIRNAAGEIIGGAAIGRDITELKGAEKALRALNEERVDERTGALREKSVARDAEPRTPAVWEPPYGSGLTHEICCTHVRGPKTGSLSSNGCDLVWWVQALRISVSSS